MANPAVCNSSKTRKVIYACKGWADSNIPRPRATAFGFYCLPIMNIWTNISNSYFRETIIGKGLELPSRHMHVDDKYYLFVHFLHCSTRFHQLNQVSKRRLAGMFRNALLVR
jgi:hypothetical protein